MKWKSCVLTTSDKVIECLEKIFTTHGLPQSRGNGPQFRSGVFERYLEENGIEHRKTTCSISFSIKSFLTIF